MFNKQKSPGEWKTNDILSKEKYEEDLKFLALLIQMEAIAKSTGGPRILKNNGRNGKGMPG
eukprot:14367077-Ditylum_brightwellii.AAC.1